MSNAPQPRRGGMFIEYVAPTELKRIIAFAINISFPSNAKRAFDVDSRNSRCKIGLKKPPTRDYTLS